jgi:hypothetical protein
LARGVQRSTVEGAPKTVVYLNVPDRSTLGKVRTCQFEKNPFLVIVQDSGQTSILDDLDYLEFKDGSNLIPLDSLSLRFVL